MFCTKCGYAIPDNAKFCTRCGTPVAAVPEKDAGTQTAVNAVSRNAQAPAVPKGPVFESKSIDFHAPSLSGEASFGSVSEGSGTQSESTEKGPGKVLGDTLRSFFSSLGSALRDPKKLIPAFILAGLWLILNILKACGIDPMPARITSFLTFADAGMSGGIAGAIGGIIGKGLFAGAVVSLIGLFTKKDKGPKRSFGETLKGAFGADAGTVWAYLTGAGAAMLFYLFISGGSTRMAFMGGIAAAYLAARSALNNGFLRRFIGSFGSKKRGGSGSGAAGFVRGMATGFAASSVIGYSGINLILIILGSLLFLGGIVMMILQACGVLKTRKGAQA